MKKVSEKALVSRINRRLAHNDETLKKCRENSRWYHDLGDWYLVDIRINGIIGKHIDLEEYGRELGVLSEDESLAN